MMHAAPLGFPASPLRPPGAHKGTFGTVIVLGGCRTMFGAPALAARAALRAGCGLVKVASDPDTLPWILSLEPSATGIELPADADEAEAALDRADPRRTAVLAVGPGWGAPPHGTLDAAARARRELLPRLWAGPRRLVLDADGLNLLAALLPDQPPAACPAAVLTPHPGEFARLADALGIQESPTDPAERPAAAAALARRLGCVVLLKGRHSVIAAADGAAAVNPTGNPVLATAGTGDVLTGLVASLLAQGMGAFEAARLGAHLHGLAADRWRDVHGERGLLARELADGLAGVMG